MTGSPVTDSSAEGSTAPGFEPVAEEFGRLLAQEGDARGQFALALLNMAFLLFEVLFNHTIQVVFLKQLNTFFGELGVPILKDLNFLQYQFLLYGIALVLMMLFRPEGLFPSRRRRRELHVHDDVDDAEFGSPGSLGAVPGEALE